MRLGLFLAHLRQVLSSFYQDSSWRAKEILSWFFQVPQLEIDLDYQLTSTELNELYSVLDQHLRYIPLEYIFQRGYCLSCQGEMSAQSLVPRPETEELAHICAQWLKKRWSKKVGSCPKVLELACGSGLVLLALVSEFAQEAQLYASDIQEGLVHLCKRNIATYCKSRALNYDIRKGDWWSAWPGESFDLVICNPPYISRLDEQRVSIATWLREPHRALFSEDLFEAGDGLAEYGKIASVWRDFLNPGGLLALEAGDLQTELLCKLFGKGKLIEDICGKKRFFLIERE